MRETLSTEELYQQYLNGKSIEELSNETGKGKWALYKRFERLRSRQEESEDAVLYHNVEEIYPEVPNKSDGRGILIAFAIIAIILLGYWIYEKFHNRIKPYTDNKKIIENQG